MTVLVSISPIFNCGSQFNNQGNLLAGGMIYTYQAGSDSVQAPTYDNDTGTPVANDNPIILDASGRLPVSVWLEQDIQYHIVLTDSDGNVLESHDYISGSVSNQDLVNALAGLSSSYLPLTGGTVTGSLGVNGTTSLRNTSVTGTFSTTGNTSLGITTATSVTATLDANSAILAHVATPVATTDAANKAYVDSATSSVSIPAGITLFTAATSAPTGWLIANGASLLQTDYPALFTAIGTTYGSVDSTHFTLPDLRGYFIRGLDLGRGIDGGRALGTNQACSVQPHKHNSAWGEAGSGPFGQSDNTGHYGSHATDTDNNWWWTSDGTPTDGSPNAAGVITNETRPINIAMTPIIKY